jgi:NAD(P)-dependent dehydrogenase (short-subunit alcohol dehydrogenase family)
MPVRRFRCYCRKASRGKHGHGLKLRASLPHYRRRYGLAAAGLLLGGDVHADAAIAAAQGHICEPEEVAQAALFLASDEASFINGTHLFVDNGFTAI